ncbi:hypothetical protein [Candidatus Foliamicus sp.]
MKLRKIFSQNMKNLRKAWAAQFFRVESCTAEALIPEALDSRISLRTTTLQEWGSVMPTPSGRCSSGDVANMLRTRTMPCLTGLGDISFFRSAREGLFHHFHSAN